jgi:hypothetical protein
MKSFKNYIRIRKFSLFRTKEKFVEDGEIHFYDDRIVINKKIFYLDQINTIDIFQFDDYVGKMLKEVVSQGVGNVVRIHLSDGQILSSNFQQLHRYQIRDIRDQLIAYYKAGKFDFDNLTMILGLENYNAIQNFKNTLSIKSY